jgi:hypothetical protein
MRGIFRAAVVLSALGTWGAWAVAQDSAAVSLTEPEAAARAEDRALAEKSGALPGDSHVRMVRLSDVKGSLALDRRTGHGFEQTMPNMPIVQGERLKTADGYAEVEFEDSSMLRLAPDSRVDFALLALRSSGAKASTMSVARGTVYVTTESTKGNEFVLVAGDTKIAVAPGTHLRLEVDGKTAVLSVFKGSAEAQRGAETTLVSRKETVTLGGDAVKVAKGVEEGAYDAWDKDANEYHERYAKANSFAGGGSTFGLSDLNYYGSFFNAGGCGQMWQPYFVSAAWNPYANGVWALYPGAGYSWVSSYPWGWMPYHTGAWSYCPAYGWGWQPGGGWSGLNNIAVVAPTGSGKKSPVHSPLRPAPPALVAGAARPSLVLANSTPLVFSGQGKAGTFVFQRDSAGLGVPRGAMGSLNKVSNQAVRQGSASMRVYAALPGGEPAFAGGMSRGPVTLRAGSPPVSASSLAAGQPSGFTGSTATAASSSGSAASAGSYRGAAAAAPSGGGGARGGSPK